MQLQSEAEKVGWWITLTEILNEFVLDAHFVHVAEKIKLI